MNDTLGDEGGPGLPAAPQWGFEGFDRPASPAPTPPIPPPPAVRAHRRRSWMPGVAVVAVLLIGGGVAAAVLVSRSGSTHTVRSVRPAPAPSVAPPTRLTASKSPFAVVLSWSPARTEVQSYDVFRNDTLIGQVRPPALRYSDRGLTPGRRYRYEVRAVNGSVQSGLTGLVVVTPKPPLRKAVIEGDFDVHVKVESATGFSQYDPTYTLGWRFSRTCEGGACVAWRDLGNDSLRGVLTRNGKTYSGEDSGKLGTCSGVRATGTVTVSFHVAKARGITGQWRATKLVGTLEESTASQLGCVSTHAVSSFVANLT